MKICNDSAFKVAWLVGKNQGEDLEVSVLVKGTFRMVAGGVVSVSEEGDSPIGDVRFPETSKECHYYDSDFVPKKVRTDVVLVGTCHTPKKSPLPACRVEFGVGRWSKALAVIGDRTWTNRWLSASYSDPVPFVSMPIRYDHAFGGDGYVKNPIGKGIDLISLPNIEYPDRLIKAPDARPDPAGFGPLHSSWEQRAGKPSQFKKSYLKERWPWYPEDFDYSSFNCAPRDQQLEGSLRGDESLRMVNLHPEHSVFESQLPGIRPQVFLLCKNGGDRNSFHEVPLGLDTLWIDMDAEKLVLVWRGQAPVSHIKLEDVAELHVVQGLISEMPRTPMTYAAEIKKREGEQQEAEDREAELARLEDEAEDREIAKSQSELDELAQKSDQQIEQRKQEAKALLVEEGLDPGLLDQPVAPVDFSKLVAELKAMVAELPQSDPKLLQAIEEFESHPPVVPEVEGEPEVWTRERCLLYAREGKSFAEEDLSGLDLSGIDLTGVNLSGIVLTKANLSGSQLSQANLSSADLSGANLSEAMLSGADLTEADFTRADLSKANLRGANLDRALFCGIIGLGVFLDETKGSLVDFSEANLSEAQFVGSRLIQPDFSDATLQRAVFRQAVMPHATFAGCHASDIIMESADMLGLRAGDAPDFSDGDFRRLKADGSFWEGARLDGARFQWASLQRADFTGASLKGAQFGAASLSGASFEDGSLEQASLIFANVFKGSFERTNLTNCDLRRANCYEAEFWDARLENTLLDDANVTMTKLASRL